MLLGNKCDMEDKRMISKERGETVSLLLEEKNWTFVDYIVMVSVERMNVAGVNFANERR